MVFNNISVISCQSVLLVEHTNVESQNTIMLNYKVEEQTKEKQTTPRNDKIKNCTNNNSSHGVR
jgi:hypothetical protein